MERRAAPPAELLIPIWFDPHRIPATLNSQLLPTARMSVGKQALSPGTERALAPEAATLNLVT